jgi:phosphocarrier protein HPr
LKVERKVKVKNRMGLHTRPATAIVKMLQNSKSTVHFTHKKMTINAKSILSILILAAQKNASITIAAEGDDAEDAVDRLVMAFANEFGENISCTT